MRQAGVVFQVFADIVLALANFLAIVAVPGAGFFDELVRDAQFDHFAFAADAFTVQNIEISLTERRADLVLDHFHSGFVADDFVALLDAANAADVQAHRGVELQRIAAGGGFRAAKHHANLHADLVDENHQGVGALDIAGQLAQRLAHQPGLQANMAVAHFAFDFRLGHQRRHRVDDNHVHPARAHQHVADFQRLFASVRLRDQQVIHIHAQLAGVLRIQRVFRVDKGAGAAQLLRLGHHLQTQRGFARGFRAKDFHHPTTRQPAHAQRQIQPQRAGGDHLQVFIDLRLVHFHDRALAKLLFDLRKSGGQRFGLVVVCHGVSRE